MAPAMAKVAPDGEKYGAFKTPIKRGPIPGTTPKDPLTAFDETYVERKQACPEKFFKTKSGREYCYWTDGTPDCDP